jgi:hypothetical protein
VVVRDTEVDIIANVGVDVNVDVDKRLVAVVGTVPINIDGLDVEIP